MSQIKLLAVSDIESRFIWEHFDKELFKDIRLIISCGDLKSSYLSFLVTMIPAPLFYVHGNHDLSYKKDPPGGCVCVDDTVIEYNGLKIGGLGGARGTKPDSFQYNDSQMRKRTKRLENEIKKRKGIDIFVTHSPPLGYGAKDDDFHRGFQEFLHISEVFKPKLHLFGHNHLNGSPVNKNAVAYYGNTKLINATGYRIIELDENKEVIKHGNQSSGNA